MRAFRIAAAVLGTALLIASCASPSAPQGSVDFIVDVSGERFVLRLADPAAIALADANLRGTNTKFPIGPLRQGHGGFNQPWSWHFDPEETTLVDLAMEVCDGRPTYVETHRDDYPSYCPWGARVVARR